MRDKYQDEINVQAVKYENTAENVGKSRWFAFSLLGTQLSGNNHHITCTRSQNNSACDDL